MPICDQLQDNAHDVRTMGERKIEEKETKTRKGTSSGHTSDEQETHQCANKTSMWYMKGKDKGLHAHKTVPLIKLGLTSGLSLEGVTEHEMQQV